MTTSFDAAKTLEVEPNQETEPFEIISYAVPLTWLITRRLYKVSLGLTLGSLLAFVLMLMCSQSSTGEQKNEFVRYAAIAGLVGSGSTVAASALKPL